MFKNATEESPERCAAEAELAREFPKLYQFFFEHPVVRPQRAEAWERTLRVARNCEPILTDLRIRGLKLVRIDQYTPPGTDRRPLYQTVIEWLPRIQDPLTLSICLGPLGEPEARALVKKNREPLLRLARLWHEQLRENDREQTLARLSDCLMKAVLERDLPEVLKRARDSSLPTGARASYVSGLQRFARKSGLARDALVELLNDREIGQAAVWALAGALKAEALPILQELRATSPYESVRAAATAVSKKIEARLRQVDLPNASPTMLPQGYASSSIEFDTDRVPELLMLLERELKGRLNPGVGQQLAVSATQLKRGQGRFHIVPLTLSDGTVSQLGFGLYAEDEDAIIVEIHFDARLRGAVGLAFDHFLDKDEAEAE